MNIKSITSKITDEGLLVTSVYSFEQPTFSSDFFDIISERLEDGSDSRVIPYSGLKEKWEERSYLFKIVDDVFTINDIQMNDSPMLPPGLLYASTQLFTNTKINKEIKEFVKSSITTTIDREETYSDLSKIIPQIKEMALSEGMHESEEIADYAVEMVVFVASYSFPHFLKFKDKKQLLTFVFDEFYYAWMRNKDFMNQPTVSRFSDSVFGSRRKTFRRVANFMNPIELYTANRLSDVVSADELEFAVKDFNEERANPLDDLPDFDANLLSNFSSTVRKNLLKSLFEAYENTRDAFDMVSRYATDYSLFKGVKTVEQLHDLAMKLIPELTDDNYLENMDPDVRENQEIDASNCSIKMNLLTNQIDFVSVGDELKICIGSASYFENAMDSKAYCYTIFRGDVLIGAIEVAKKNDRWQSIQCRGFKNSKIDNEEMIVNSLLMSLETPDRKKEFLSISTV